MFDVSNLNPDDLKAVESALDGLSRNEAFREIMAKASAQYGPITIRFTDQNSCAKLWENPPAIEVGRADLLRNYFISPDKKTIPLSLHRVITHELSHFAYDKGMMREHITRYLAGIMQQASNAASVLPEMRPFHLFLGYEGREEMLVDRLQKHPSPIQLKDFIGLAEPFAIASTNTIMRRLYAEAPRSELPEDYRSTSPLSVQTSPSALYCSADANYDDISSLPKPSAERTTLCAQRYMGR